MKTFCGISLYVFVFLFFGIVGSVSSADTVLDACTEAQAFVDYTNDCIEPVQTAVDSYMQFNPEVIGSDIGSRICGDAMEEFEACMEKLNGVCSSHDLLGELPDIISGYKSEFCSGGKLLERIEDYEQILDPSKYIQLLENAGCNHPSESITRIVAGDCLEDWFDLDLSVNVVDIQEQATATFRGIFSCLRQELDSCNNLKDMIPYAFYIYSQRLVPGLEVTFDEVVAGFDDSGVNPNSDARSTVAVFGDPHLRIYNARESEYITCSSPGETNYLSNNYVVVVGVNTAAEVDSYATFMTAVDVKVYDGVRGKDRTLMASYIAEGSSLPTGFMATDSDSDVAIADLGSNTIRISSYDSGLAITIRRIQHTYMMVIRMSDTVLAQSSGLLYEGCPADEQIHRDEMIQPQRRRKREVSCGTGIYADACEYDYGVTGNATLSEASVESMEELTSDIEELDSTFIDDDDSGAVTLATTPLLLIITAVALVVTSLM